MRYELHAIANDECTKINNETLSAYDTIEEAKAAAGKAVETYGTAIVDTTTGKVDFGFGFGVAVPEFGEEN